MTGCLQIKNNTYYAVLDYKDKNGKRKRKWLSTGLPVRGNKRRADDFLKNAINQYKEINMNLSLDILFSDFMYIWLDSVKNSIEVNTYESYSDIIKRYIYPFFEGKNIKLINLEPMIIQQMYNYYMNQGLSSTTVLKIHANVRKALQYAIKMNMITYNPADRVEKPKKQKYKARFYDVDQINELMKIVKDEPMYTVVLLAAFYGLRRSEVLGLKWCSVDLKDNTIIICNTVVEYKTILEKERTKTKSSMRTLPLVQEIKEHLLKLKEQQEKDAVIFGNTYFHNDYVCKRNNGQTFRPNYITERFYKIIRRSSLPHIRFHDLRHSSATLLISSGFSLKEIQEWMGHADISTTANIYAHIQYKAKQNMANSLSEKIKITNM